VGGIHPPFRRGRSGYSGKLLYALLVRPLLRGFSPFVPTAQRSEEKRYEMHSEWLSGTQGEGVAGGFENERRFGISALSRQSARWGLFPVIPMVNQTPDKKTRQRLG